MKFEPYLNEEYSRVMKKLLLLLLLSLGFIGNASALGGYKCTPKQAYGVTDEGILQNDINEHPNHWLNIVNTGKDFVIDRETGRFLGGGYPIEGDGYTFTIASTGGERGQFRAYYIDSNNTLSINVQEFNKSYAKPFVYTILPHPVVITGTCIHY